MVRSAHPRTVKIRTALVAGLVVAASSAQAQIQSWDYKARERSQAASSLGQTHLTKGAVDSAISSLLEATRHDPSDPLPYALLGLALDMKGRYAEALDALYKSYKLDPGRAETVLSIGFTHYLMHNYDKALNAFKKVLELNPKLCHIYGDMGFTYLRMAQFDKANESFRKLLDCHPNSQVAYHGIAMVRYLGGDFAGARQSGEQAQSIYPYPPVLLLLAKLDFLQGDRSRGLRRVQEYIKLTRKPWTQRPMTALGFSHQHDFRWDPLLADNFDNGYLLWARALDLPRGESKRRSLSRQGKAAAAVEQAARARDAAPEDFYIVRELGLVELAAGHYSDAAQHFKKTMELCPDCHVELLHAGRALALDGKAAEASAYVRKFQKKLSAQQISPVFVEIARVDPGLAETAAAPQEPAAGQDGEAEKKDAGF